MAQEKSVVELLNAYHTSPVTQKLREKFLTPSIFDVIQKDRSETVHSNFLKWIFDLQVSNGVEGFNIISSLLQAVNKRASEQGKELPTDLLKAVYGNHASIQISKKVEREYRCPGVYFKSEKKRNFGIVDLVITGSFSQGSQIKPFKIIIENKVDTKEHDSQTWKYYTFFERGKQQDIPENIVIEGEPQYECPDDEQRIYLFLTPEFNPKDAKCECKHFIKINYQDIMDYCIMPLLESSRLDSRNRIFLEEYSRALSLPYINNIGKTIIMSLSEVEKDLLKEFWEANQELITMSLQALTESSKGKEEKDEIEETLNAIENLKSSRKKFSITHIATGKVKQTNQSNLMLDLMEMYDKHSSKTGKAIVSQYEKIGKVFCDDITTTGYSKDKFTFEDGTSKRVTTQIQRYAGNLKRIREIAEADGFFIESC